MNIGDKVKVKCQEIEGVIEKIDKTHPSIAIRIKIIKGRTAITDYFADMLELIQ